MKKTNLRMLIWALAALPLMAVAGGAVLSPVADAEVATCGDGVAVFDDRTYQMTPAAAERLAGKTFFRRTIDGGFAAEVVKGGELFVVTPTEKAGKHLSQGKPARSSRSASGRSSAGSTPPDSPSPTRRTRRRRTASSPT